MSVFLNGYCSAAIRDLFANAIAMYPFKIYASLNLISCKIHNTRELNSFVLLWKWLHITIQYTLDLLLDCLHGQGIV